MTYNEIMQKAGKRIKPNLYYYNNDVKIEISRNDIIKIRPHYSTGLIGTIMRGLEIELKISIPTSTIYFKNMAMFEENSQAKDYGEYYLKEKGTYNADTKTYTYQFYDGFLKLMVPYKTITIDYPCTVNDFIKKLANEMGLKCNVDLTNGSNYLGTDIYENIDMTYRDVVADIGQGTFTLFEIVNNELKVCNFKENEIIINDDILKNKNITFNKKNGAFNTIIISRSAESDSLSKSNPENLPDDEKIAYRISNCQLLNRNDRGDYLDGLLNKVYGIEYYVYNVELTGYGGFDPLQKIKFETSNKTFNSYVLNNEEIITQGYEENISASEIENVEQNYKVTDTDDRRINNVSLIVDKQQKEINALANKIVDISKTVSGVGFVNITNGYKGNLHKLDIYGYMELPIVGGHLGTEPSKVGTLKTGYAITKTYKQYIKPLITGEFKVNNFYLYIEQDNKILHKYLLPIKYLYSVGDVHDEFNYLEGKCSVTRKVGIHANGVKYALSTPYTEELPNLIIEVPEGDYKIYTTFDSLHLNVEYLTQNEYTDTFATQVDVQSSIKIATDEVLIQSKTEILDNGDSLIASINTKSSGDVLINASRLAEINANQINFNSYDFNVTTQNMKISIGSGDNVKDIINANGVLTTIIVIGTTISPEFIFSGDFAPLGDYWDGSDFNTKEKASFSFFIPSYFEVVNAYIDLQHEPCINHTFINGVEQSITGWCRNLRIYKGNIDANAKLFVNTVMGFVGQENVLYSPIYNGWINVGTDFTGSNNQLTSATSIDLKSNIKKGLNNFIIASNDSSSSQDTEEYYKKKGGIMATLYIQGYTKI